MGGEQTSAQTACVLTNSPRWPQVALPPGWAPRKPVCRPPSNTSVFAVEHQEASRFPRVPAAPPELQPNPCLRCKPPMQVSGRCIPSSAQSHRCSGGTLDPVHHNAQLVFNSKQASNRLGSKAALCPGGCGGIKRGIISKQKKSPRGKKILTDVFDALKANKSMWRHCFMFAPRTSSTHLLFFLS